jgi:cellulose biosynthesis protein BcsQ
MEGKTVLAGNIAKTLKQEGKRVLFLNYEGKQEDTKQQRKPPIINKILGYQDQRIDINNPFLAHVSNYLDSSEHYSYNMGNQFYNAKSYTDILEQDNLSLDYTPDFVIIELPALFYHNYPAGLIAQADLGILVCRSNRTWSASDKSAINNLLEASAAKIKFIVNGVNINETESILGDLTKKRSTLRKKLKSMFKFHFFSQNQI